MGLKFLQKKMRSPVILLTFCFWGSGTANIWHLEEYHPREDRGASRVPEVYNSYNLGGCNCEDCKPLVVGGVCVDIYETQEWVDAEGYNGLETMNVCGDKGELKGDMTLDSSLDNLCRSECYSNKLVLGGACQLKTAGRLNKRW